MIKKICAILTIAIVTTLFIQTSIVYADQEGVQEKVLNALKNVAGIDVDKYAVEVKSYSASPVPGREESYRGEEDIYLTLKSKESQIGVTAGYLNNRLITMSLYIEAGSYSDVRYIDKLSDDPLVATKQALYRLKAFTGNSVILDMQSMIEPAKSIEDIVNKTVGNIRCKVFRDTSMSFVGDESCPVSGVYFMYSINGAESPKSIGVHFENGVFAGFHDGWDLYAVGSETVQVSRDQAIAMARDQAVAAAESVSLEFPSDRAVVAELHLEIRENFMLYPFWFVELPLVYPADLSIYGWQLGVWADTGKIAYSHPVGGYGVMSDINSPSNSSTTPSDNIPSLQGTRLFIIAGVVATISIIGLIAIIRKKR